MGISNPNVPQTDTIKKVEEMKSPRFVKSHLSFQMLPSALFRVKAKVLET